MPLDLSPRELAILRGSLRASGCHIAWRLIHGPSPDEEKQELRRELTQINRALREMEL